MNNFRKGINTEQDTLEQSLHIINHNKVYNDTVNLQGDRVIGSMMHDKKHEIKSLHLQIGRK